MNRYGYLPDGATTEYLEEQRFTVISEGRTVLYTDFSYLIIIEVGNKVIPAEVKFLANLKDKYLLRILECEEVFQEQVDYYILKSHIVAIAPGRDLNDN